MLKTPVLGWIWKQDSLMALYSSRYWLNIFILFLNLSVKTQMIHVTLWVSWVPQADKKKHGCPLSKLVFPNEPYFLLSWFIRTLKHFLNNSLSLSLPLVFLFLLFGLTVSLKKNISFKSFWFFHCKWFCVHNVCLL